MELLKTYLRYWFWPSLAFCLLVVIMLVWPGFARDSVQSDVANRIEQALLEEGLDEVSVAVKGRDVVLSGNVGAADSDRMMSIARSVADHRGLIAPRIVSWNGDIIAKTDADFEALRVINEALEQERIDALPEDKRQCQIRINEVRQTSTIKFETNKSDIRPGNKPLLDELISILEVCPSAVVVVEGHTDNVGDSESNMKLSESRAASVVNYLQKDNQLTNQITFVGYGETRPVATNETLIGQSQNRRIQFIIK